MLIARSLGDAPRALLGFPITTPQGVAMAKFGEALPIVLCIVALHFVAGGKADGLFLRAGRPWGWIVGFAGFLASLAVGVVQVRGAGAGWSILALTFALGIFWGWLMLKSKSVWGAVIMHAGADILVIAGFSIGARI